MALAKVPLYVKKLSEQAVLPSRGSERAAGYDLHANGEYTVTAHGKELIKTGLSLAVPSGNYGRIAPRSGLAWKNFIDVGAGVIDEDYRGELSVLLFNHSDTDFAIKHGDRIAQLIIERITVTQLIETDTLDATERGSGGFGSTGVQQQQQNLKRTIEEVQNALPVEWKVDTVHQLQALEEAALITPKQNKALLSLVFNAERVDVYKAIIAARPSTTGESADKENTIDQQAAAQNALQQLLAYVSE